MRRSVIPRWPTAFWTEWYTMLTGSNCQASPSARRKAGVPPTAGREVVHERSPVDTQAAHGLVRGRARSGAGHDVALRRSFQTLSAPLLAGGTAYWTGAPQCSRVGASIGERSGLDRSLSWRTVPESRLRGRCRRRNLRPVLAV